MRTTLALSLITLIAVTLSSVTGDEPNQPIPDRLTFRWSLSKGDVVIYPVASAAKPTDSNPMIISCDSLRFASKGRIVVTNATIETKEGRLSGKGELALDVDDLPSITFSSSNGGGIREMQFIKPKSPAGQAK